jgi:hypothetical protein
MSLYDVASLSNTPSLSTAVLNAVINDFNADFNILAQSQLYLFVIVRLA